jgi:prepilin-type N-terminal cleavage/methylation domain-containing protein
MMHRRGFTIVELIVGTVVMAILGTILARMLVQDSRFVSKLEAMMDARQSARAAMNTMALELRMVSDDGLLAATPTLVTVRAPYAWGILCEAVGTERVASLVPTDAMWYGSAIPDGVAWRDNTGTYRFDDDVTIVSPPTNPGACTDPDWFVQAGGLRIGITQLGGFPSPQLGDIFYLYQTISYEFRTSADIPGPPPRIGLWREVNGSATEILAPFDTTAGFRFFLDPNDPPIENPVDLAEVTGVELRLHGQSELTPQGTNSPEEFYLQTRVTFLNIERP